MNKVKDYYNHIYDYAGDLKIDWPRMMRWLEFLSLCFTGKMLDIGCGTGRTFVWAQEHNLEWYGIDISNTAIDFAQFTFDACARVMNAENLPQDMTNSFDVVIALGSLEHMDHPEQALSEMYRVLMSGGLAVILVPNKIAPLEALGLYHGTEQPRELRLSKRGWIDMIKSAGFEICRIRKDYGPPVFKNWKPHKIIQRALLKLSHILPDSFAYCFIFDCIKGE